jgi:hypothetical protein
VLADERERGIFGGDRAQAVARRVDNKQPAHRVARPVLHDESADEAAGEADDRRVRMPDSKEPLPRRRSCRDQ